MTKSISWGRDARAVPIYRKVRAGAIVRDGSRVLMTGMLSHGPDPIRWYAFPGGGVDPGEDAETAALRELYEETGLRGELGAELVQVGSLGLVHTGTSKCVAPTSRWAP